MKRIIYFLFFIFYLNTAFAVSNGATVYFVIPGICGNNACSWDETCLSCPDDCGTCISNVKNYSITTASVIINWTTSGSSNSTVYYGTSINSLDSIKSDPNNQLNHQIELTSLSSNTLYFYNVSSCLPGGVCAYSSKYNFTTLSEAAAGGGGGGGGTGVWNETIPQASKKYICEKTFDFLQRFNITYKNLLQLREEIEEDTGLFMETDYIYDTFIKNFDSICGDITGPVSVSNETIEILSPPPSQEEPEMPITILKSRSSILYSTIYGFLILMLIVALALILIQRGKQKYVRKTLEEIAKAKEEEELENKLL